MTKSSGYFDLQVNGYGGVDYNVQNLSADDFHESCVVMRKDEVSAFLPTITTEAIAKMARSIHRIVELRAKDPLAKEMIPGLHVEGPFISPIDGYRGAHPRDAVIPADPDSMQKLLDAADGLVRLVTLAPESDPGGRVTRMLIKQGVRVSAGHTNATMDQLLEAIDAGLSMYTHLGNGCPMMMHRHENIVQRALSLSDRLWLMFIADGAHVAFPALKNYLRAAGMERTIVVTDAVAPAGKGPGRYTMGRWDLLIGEDLVARAPDGSHLVGSAMSMPQAVKRLVENVGLTPQQAHQLTAINPRRAMDGADNQR